MRGLPMRAHAHHIYLVKESNSSDTSSEVVFLGNSAAISFSVFGSVLVNVKFSAFRRSNSSLNADTVSRSDDVMRICFSVVMGVSRQKSRIAWNTRAAQTSLGKLRTNGNNLEIKLSHHMHSNMRTFTQTTQQNEKK